MNFYEYKHYKINEYNYGYKSFDNENIKEHESFCLTPDGIYDVRDNKNLMESFINDNNDENWPNFLFFKPFFFFSNNKWELFEYDCKKKFEITSSNIIKKTENRKQNFSLQLTFSVFCEKNSFKYQNFNLQINDSDQGAFLNSLENFKTHSNYFFNLSGPKDLSTDFVVQDNLLVRKDSFGLSGNIIFCFDIKSKEKLVFLFNRQQSTFLKKINYFIKIPSYTSIELYEKDKEYSVGAIVVYENALYKCKKISKDQISLHNNEYWDIFESFDKSFFNSSEGKKTLRLLKKQIAFLVEQKISNEIIFQLSNIDYKDIPNLNDFFEFDKKKYRIIEVFQKNIEGVWSLTIKGIEVLHLNDFDFESIIKDFDGDYAALDNLNINIVENNLEVTFLDRLITNQEKILRLEVGK
ncbi:hypothetical protein [Alphaproteobacteria bacterium endosymbiont of Tiliacea citrago]|uniref:hypothetical protein n=1 Tax=Alphaproteobacteria bacterium endosymbiont of Tiliacea citrago TaxID=3077944 RepID=UPI00313D2EC1